ncbi:20121_t:CDS:2 [Entrophospora sp. SA101]|nr:20121_t:CDS:2 [Entrophospora sp. SA101]
MDLEVAQVIIDESTDITTTKLNQDPDAFEEEIDDSINRTKHWVELVQNWMDTIDDNKDISDPLGSPDFSLSSLYQQDFFGKLTDLTPR